MSSYNRGHTVLLCRHILLSAAVTGIVGCVTVQPVPPQLPAAPGTSETSVAFSPSSGSSPSTVVVQFNDFFGGSFFGWSWTDNGATWNYCNAVPPLTMTVCGGPVPLAPNQLSWRGDPGVAAAQDGSGIVIATQLAQSISSRGYPDMIVASVSRDGGRTFTSSVQVNDGDCFGGGQDMQEVAVDTTASVPTFWVSWRHNGAVDTGTGTGGLCVRGLSVDPATGAVSFLRSSENVENVDRSPFWSVGGVVVQAGDGLLTVVYSNTDHAFLDCSSGKTVRWFSVSSTNNGVDWSESTEIYRTDDFDWCAGGDRHLTGIRAFDFKRGPDGSYWVVLHDTTQYVRIFHSRDLGSNWTEINRVTSPGARSILMPNIAVDQDGRVAVGLNASDRTDSRLAYHVAASQGASEPTVWSLATPVSSFFTVPGTVGVGGRSLGDFNGMTNMPPNTFPGVPGTFIASWATSAGGLPEVALGYVQVSP